RTILKDERALSQLIPGFDLGPFKKLLSEFIEWGEDVSRFAKYPEPENALLDPAMITPKSNAATIPRSPDAATFTPGGIDLSQQDSALHVEKDANGGVKVNVDPALIARVEREGLPEVVPVIINMQPADVRTLFGPEGRI